MKEFDLISYLEGSTRASGVNLKVEDRKVLADVVNLIR